MVFSCDVCHKTYTRDEALYSHKVQKPNCSSCQYCGHRFSGRNQIRRHMKSNHLDFKCSLCTRKFFLSSGRDTHKRAKHGSDDLYGASANVGLHSDHGLGNMYTCRASPVPVTTFVSKPYQIKSVTQCLSNLTISPRITANTKFLSDLRSNGSMENLLASEVKPDPDKTRKRNSIVDSLVRFMQHNTKYGIREVLKAGSSGKGTSIKNKADIDLVVNINDYSTVGELQENMDCVLKKLHDHVLKDATWADHVHFTRYTSHSIRFGLRKNAGDEMVEVDLLPAIDLGEGDRGPIFDRMSKLSPKERSFYSVSFAKDQVKFVDRVPGDVKNLIRLVKHWKRREDIDIVSYCIELIVIKQWMGWGEPTNLDLKTRFKQVMGELTRLSTMQITWPSRYNTSKYGRYPSPAVTDPANPFINTADRIHDIPGIERKAKELYDLL